MALLTLTFEVQGSSSISSTDPGANYFNDSLQVGDQIYYATATSLGGFNVELNDSQIVQLGSVTQITESLTTNTIVVDLILGVAIPSAGDFIFFSKDRSVNVSSLVGYFGEVTFKNSSTDKAELFSVACEISESSK